ncbi:MAG: 4-hydroxy-tetrahydrodipicolinate reductase [Bacteroidia bacterium]|nr:4-hydroxy-tetrahydrodipicolinate reductase [Bacteroidia bacterium]MBT8287124.1 4-hydroxy-tetrahydrodipicolinate reductase [Bacteroidia bacterium]
MKVAVSGANGRLGRVISKGVSKADDMQLTCVYAPGYAGETVAGLEFEEFIVNVDADIIVECSPPDSVMENLRVWHSRGMGAVIGTSGFTKERIQELKSFWGKNDPGCLIVPNFSIGAILMMRFAEQASPFFDSAEIIERHETRKPDAPSGTALATAMRMGKHQKGKEQPSGKELIKGVRGGLVSGVRVHSLRMKGILSDQEVAFSNNGEIFSVHHSSTSYESFVKGALMAIRHVKSIRGVAIGLDAALGFES